MAQQAALCTQASLRCTAACPLAACFLASSLFPCCQRCLLSSRTALAEPAPPLQVHSPTAVTHCAAAWLTRASPRGGGGGGGSALPDLVVVRSTQLELHSVRSTSDTAPGGGAPVAGAALELVASSRLFGVVESVAVLRGRAPGQRDALLLTFR